MLRLRTAVLLFGLSALAAFFLSRYQTREERIHRSADAQQALRALDESLQTMDKAHAQKVWMCKDVDRLTKVRDWRDRPDRIAAQYTESPAAEEILGLCAISSFYFRQIHLYGMAIQKKPDDKQVQLEAGKNLETLYREVQSNRKTLSDLL